MRLHLLERTRRASRSISALGLLGGVRYLLNKALEKTGGAPAEIVVAPKALRHPLRLRTRPSSDTLVFEQVCVDRQFDFLDRLSGQVSFILDLGANIGCSSALFLSAFPDASVIAVEPDPGNAARCADNLRPYGDRATVIRGAVWHTGGSLVLSRNGSLEWAVQVREAAPDEQADVPAYTVRELLARSGFPQIDLLKVDIEGSETGLFSHAADDWLGAVRNICIETHGTAAERAVRTALAGFACDTGQVGEHTLYLNLSRNR